MSRSINIVHVVSQLDCGGTEVNVIQIVEGLNRRGFDQTVVCLTDVAEPDLVDRLTCRVVRADCTLRFPHSSFFLRRVLRRTRADIVHGRGFVTWLDCCGARKLFPGDVRLIQSFHGPNTFAQLRFRRQLAASILRRSTDVALAVSHDLGSRLIRQWKVPADKVEVIPNGVAIRDQRCMLSADAARQLLGLRDQVFIIGCLGSLYDVKNRAFLIKAFQRVLQRVPHTRLLIVGDGPQRATLESMSAQLGLEAYVQFVGYQAQVHQYLAAMDIFVQPSYCEGSPTAVLEAMAMGLPVVAARSAGCTELGKLHRVPLLVDNDDVDALAEILIRLIENRQQRLQLGEYGAQIVTEHYSRERMLDGYERVYRQVLSTVKKRNNRSPALPAHQ